MALVNENPLPATSIRIGVLTYEQQQLPPELARPGSHPLMDKDNSQMLVQDSYCLPGLDHQIIAEYTYPDTVQLNRPVRKHW